MADQEDTMDGRLTFLTTILFQFLQFIMQNMSAVIKFSVKQMLANPKRFIKWQRLDELTHAQLE